MIPKTYSVALEVGFLNACEDGDWVKWMLLLIDNLTTRDFRLDRETKVLIYYESIIIKER